MKLCIIFVLALFLFSCSDTPYPSPHCRIKDGTQISINHASLQATAAACIVRMNGKLLVLERSSGLYDLAYSQKISSSANKIRSNENINTSSNTPQCQAHHAMWDYSGFNVLVGELLVNQSNDTHLYACELQAGFDGTEAFIEPAPWHASDVKSLTFIDPFEIEQDQWHSPDHFTAARDGFVASRKLSQIDSINTSD